MSVKPKSSYNPLTDPHLAAHYASRRQRKHLKSAGLVRKFKFYRVLKFGSFS